MRFLEVRPEIAMRLLPLLALLAGCGNLHALGEFREDSADTADTGLEDTGDTADTGDTDTSDTADTGHDSGDTNPPPTVDGTYTGTFQMDVMFAGSPIPVDGCTGAATVTVSGAVASGSFDCTFSLFLQGLGPQQGEVDATVSGSTVIDPYATLGLFFVFDELSGSFSGTTGLVLSEAGTEAVDGLGDFDYTAVIDVRK